jgi:uncharacterized protein YggE
MKTIRVSLIIVLLILLSGCSVPQIVAGSLAGASQAAALNPPAQDILADTTVGDRRITVNGAAQVMVVPDEVVLTLGVETWDLELAKARQENDEIVKQVFEVAEDMRIDSKYVQTDYISIEPRYQDSYTQKDFIGYFVRKNIVITLKDLDKFEELYGRALEAGVNYVHGVDFRTTELRKYRDQARALAIQAAQEKAVALASELDQEVGEPTMIQENYDNWWSGYSSWWGSYGAGAYQNVVQNSGQVQTETEDTLAPGQISVTASVTVAFELK